MAIYTTPRQPVDDPVSSSDRPESAADAETLRTAIAKDEDSAPVFRDYGSYI
ncbi:MAG TPA: hypothetical protein VGF49_13415 [Candidatus Solibacter sp.]|jgi:hypothetical protein